MTHTQPRADSVTRRTAREGASACVGLSQSWKRPTPIFANGFENSCEHRARRVLVKISGKVFEFVPLFGMMNE